MKNKDFKIYRTHFSWNSSSVKVTELTALKETEFFWTISDPDRYGKTKSYRISKSNRFDEDMYFKSIEQSLDNLLTKQTKTVKQLEERLNLEQERLDKLNLYIKERE